MVLVPGFTKKSVGSTFAPPEATTKRVGVCA